MRRRRRRREMPPRNHAARSRHSPDNPFRRAEARVGEQEPARLDDVHWQRPGMRQAGSAHRCSAEYRARKERGASDVNASRSSAIARYGVCMPSYPAVKISYFMRHRAARPSKIRLSILRREFAARADDSGVARIRIIPPPRAPALKKGYPVATTTAAEPTRRDFLYIATGAVAAVGVGARGMAVHRPDESDRGGARAGLDRSRHLVDPVGQRSRSTGAAIRCSSAAARRRKSPRRARSTSPICPIRCAQRQLPDDAPATDANRARSSRNGWCWSASAPISAARRPHAAVPQGDYGGWLCHCHGSQYDTAGRIRKGPAPQNSPSRPTRS